MKLVKKTTCVLLAVKLAKSCEENADCLADRETILGGAPICVAGIGSSTCNCDSDEDCTNSIFTDGPKCANACVAE